jgi:hypothetical protein
MTLKATESTVIEGSQQNLKSNFWGQNRGISVPFMKGFWISCYQNKKNGLITSKTISLLALVQLPGLHKAIC